MTHFPLNTAALCQDVPRCGRQPAALRLLWVAFSHRVGARAQPRSSAGGLRTGAGAVERRTPGRGNGPQHRGPLICGGMVLRGCEAGTRRQYETFRGVHRRWVAVGFQMPRAFRYARAAAITLSML